MPKSNAEKFADARERAKKAGKCTICRKRKARKNKITCKKCSDQAKERVQRSRLQKKQGELKR